MLEGKRIVVTGGTGSLGQTIVRRLLNNEMGQPAKVTVFSRDEAKQHEMRLTYLDRRVATDEVIYENSQEILDFRVGDIRDYSAVSDTVSTANVVFHAAALKQVPTCEYFPFEAIKTNILGSQNLVRAIRREVSTVELVVGVSTDKACKPINVMGLTKALQERLLTEANLDCPKTRWVCVRYGNVIASRGSVVPLFVDQIARGGPLTVTLREMTRFLLSLDEAVSTIFAAAQFGRPGETYVPKVPAAYVRDIAEALSYGKDIPIVYTGIRPGEKIHEIMISEEECYRTTERGEFYVIYPTLPELRDGMPETPAFTSEYSSRQVTLNPSTLRGLLAKCVDGIVTQVHR